MPIRGAVRALTALATLAALTVFSSAALAAPGGSNRFELTVTNNSKVARSYQLVPVGEACNSGVVLENGWVEAGETKTETFRGPRPLRARFCVDLRSEATLRFTPGEVKDLNLVSDAHDRADVSVEQPDLSAGAAAHEFTVGFRNQTPWRVQWVSVDNKLVCANSVDHPFFAPFSQGSTSFVTRDSGTCFLHKNIEAVWDVHRDSASGAILATVTKGADFTIAGVQQYTRCQAAGRTAECSVSGGVVTLTPLQ